MNAVLGEKLKSAKRYYASQMASLLLENKNNKFTVHKLPAEAQWYPVYSIAVADIYDDGKKDIITGGNQSYSRIKFGAYGSGRGDAFLNKGNGEFERILPAQSGLKIKGDIRNTVIAGKKLIVGINNQQPLVYSY